MLWPVRLGPSRLEALLQVPVDPLHHPIALGVVGGGGDVFHPQLLAGGGPDGEGELAPRCLML